MYQLVTKFKPMGDQPEAIKKLCNNLNNGVKYQTLLGATGTGKTFTIANVIKEYGKKTLILSHNKTLAGQLYSELKSFFPNNRVEYFVSYYDYYQPEAYVASRDLYIEKDASINDDLDQLRSSAVASLLTEDECIVVSSVSCIYGIGDPDEYLKNIIILVNGRSYERKKLLEDLVKMQYERNEYDLKRGTFRVKGDVIEILLPTEKDESIKLEFFDDELEKIKICDSISGKVKKIVDRVTIYPATLFNIDPNKKEEALRRIEAELKERIAYFEREDKPLEKERIAQRTKYDLEMIREIGTCPGIENYSRHLSLRGEGETPFTLMDFFGKDFLLIIDESHVTIPQIRGMYNGDRSRKQSLVDYGFRLPSALDNRPLKFNEFENKTDKVIFLSATPAEYEYQKSSYIIEQIIRPTGLLDPLVEVRGSKGQIDDLVSEIYKRIKLNERVLVMTLTIKMSEELTKYLKNLDIKVAYLHNEIKPIERLEIIRDLRKGKYDCIVGINLLREGLDIPEVSLIAILDADKEGFLRSETSLIQIIGRAARNENGKVIMYADNITKSIEKAIVETYRRREIQEKYNKEPNIIPHTIVKDISEGIVIPSEDNNSEEIIDFTKINEMNKLEKKKLIEKLEKEMYQKAKELKFEDAMALRNIIYELKA